MKAAPYCMHPECHDSRTQEVWLINRTQHWGRCPNYVPSHVPVYERWCRAHALQRLHFWPVPR